MVIGAITELDVVIRGTYVEEEWVDAPTTEEDEELSDNKTGGNDYIIVNPENGFITILPSPDGSFEGDFVYGDIVAGTLPKGEWVTTETFVELLNVQFRSYDDKSVWTISAYESIMLGANNVTITVSENQISAVLKQDDELVADATLYTTENGLHFEVTDANGSSGNVGFEFINSEEGETGICIYWCGEEYKFTTQALENGLKVTLTDGVVLEMISVSENELVINVDITDLSIYENYYEKCYIAFDGAIIIKLA